MVFLLITFLLTIGSPLDYGTVGNDWKLREMAINGKTWLAIAYYSKKWLEMARYCYKR